MKNLTKIAVCFFMAASVAATYPAFANPPTYEGVTIAFERTLAKIEEAISAMEKGVDNATIMKMINEAYQLQKEILNNEIDVRRSRASNKLKKARVEISKGELQPAEQLLREALKDYQEIKKIYDSTL
jgi:exonuclease VII small subunit